MALDQAANFVREQVTSTINAGDTTVDVTDASDFPVPPEGYNIVVWDAGSFARPDQDSNVEIMRVTDVDTTNDVLTVARGQEGTSDVQHPDTSVVVVAKTAKMIADIASEKISNPVTETVNVDGNDVTGVGALETEQLSNESGLQDSQTPLDHQAPIVEDWERQTLNYLQIEGADPTFDTTTALHRSASLRTNSDTLSRVATPFRFARGQKYRIYLYLDSHDDQGPQFVNLLMEQNQRDIFNNNDDGYIFEVRGDGQDSRLRRADDGSPTDLASSTATIPTDEWLVLEVDAEYGLLVSRVLQLDGTQVFEISSSDTTHQFVGYIGIYLSSDDAEANDNHSYADLIQRRPL